MSPFEFLQPATLSEALSLMDPEDASVRAMGGGTALMLMMKAGMLKPRRLINLRGIEPRFSEIRIDEAGDLRIGALATLSKIEHSQNVSLSAPVITRAMRRLSNVRVRNVATLGGNLAHADPHMDMPCILAALGAKVSLVSAHGERTLTIDELIAGYYETSLEPAELIGQIIVPAQRGHRSAYMKCTTRSADDWPALGIAATLDMDGDVIRACCLVVGAATDKPTRLMSSEMALTGTSGDEKTLERVGQAAVQEVDVVGDAQGSAPYKRELMRVYLARAVRAALADGGQTWSTH